MAYCDECHQHFQQYGKVASEVVPAMAAAAVIEMPRRADFNIDAAERELMSRLDVAPATQKPHEEKKPPRHIPVGLIAACVALFACALGGYFIYGRKQASVAPPIRVVSQAPAPEAPRAVAPESKAPQTIADLQQQLATSEEKLHQSTAALGTAQRQMEAEQATRQQLSDDRDALSTQLDAAQTEVQSLRDRLTSATLGSTQAASRLTSLEATVRELRTALDEKDIALQDKDRMLELDKDFLAHDRDIRDLIGARNLYIADITDTNEDGKAAKQFGRIFYTKDRSLIFYGFDLDSQARNKKDVSFQVWG